MGAICSCDHGPMELRQLRAFVAVAEEQNFTRAAQRLYVVQSAVSATVQSLERELGVTLLDRSSHPVSLTDAGRALLEEARKTLAAADAAVEAVDEVRGGLRGTVHLGTMQYRRGSRASVAQIIRAFSQQHPAVRVVTRHSGGSTEMVEQVRSGLLDLAFVGLGGEQPDGVLLTTLAREPMALVCHREHPLAENRQVRLEDLADGVFADVPATWGTRIALDGALQSAGIAREVRYEINDMPGVVDFVEQDLAIAVMPPSYVPDSPDVRILAIADAPVWLISLATPTQRTPSAASAALARVIAE
jgi:DNA-binding transcriptional LysR family regulator